jgi:signal peptidase
MTTTLLERPAAAPVASPAPDVENGAGDRDDTPSRTRRALDAVVTVLWGAVTLALVVYLLPTSLGGASSDTIISGTSMEPTYHTGDLALVRRTGDVVVGDVLVYRVPAGQAGEGRYVIHRVIGGDPVAGYVTRGDNRDTPDVWRPRSDDILGTVVAVVPQGGTWLLRAFSPAALGLAATVLFLWVLWPRSDEDEDAEDDDDRTS